jgi:hypothetical protein
MSLDERVRVMRVIHPVFLSAGRFVLLLPLRMDGTRLIALRVHFGWVVVYVRMVLGIFHYGLMLIFWVRTVVLKIVVIRGVCPEGFQT